MEDIMASDKMAHVVRAGLLYLCKNEFGRYYMGTIDSIDLVKATSRDKAIAEADEFFKSPGEYQIVQGPFWGDVPPKKGRA
jgi:hypothetical protein